MRVLGPGLIGVLAFGVWIYAIFDSIATESALVRNLPKITWIFLVILLGPIGAIAWLGFGRPINAGWSPGDTSTRPTRRPLGLEDTERWTQGPPPMAPAQPPSAARHPSGERPSPEDLEAKERRLMEWEAELRRREEEQQGD